VPIPVPEVAVVVEAEVVVVAGAAAKAAVEAAIERTMSEERRVLEVIIRFSISRVVGDPGFPGSSRTI
jgi:hypothetical protein